MENWQKELKKLCARGLKKGRPVNQTEFVGRWGLTVTQIRVFLDSILTQKEYKRLFPSGAWKSRYLNQPQPLPDLSDKKTRQKIGVKSCVCGCTELGEKCLKRYMRLKKLTVKGR